MSTKPFTTCLWFDGQAEEAAHHYTSIFENAELGEVNRVPEGAPAPAGSVMAVDFELNGQKFLALNGGPQYTFSEAISFQIHCADQDEVDYYWDSLSAGGEEGRCGWLKDKFGVSWQVIPAVLSELIGDSDPAKAKRAMEAMLSMGKFDIAALQKAHSGE